jgi:hypothetical protein
LGKDDGDREHHATSDDGEETIRVWSDQADNAPDDTEHHGALKRRAPVLHHRQQKQRSGDYCEGEHDPRMPFIHSDFPAPSEQQLNHAAGAIASARKD